jgi:hypothetical protein
MILHCLVDNSVAPLSDYWGDTVFHLNHCTGTPALVALSRAFGDRVSHLPAGTTLEMESCV